jgi:hypothetical protein
LYFLLSVFIKKNGSEQHIQDNALSLRPLSLLLRCPPQYTQFVSLSYF